MHTNEETPPERVAGLSRRTLLVASAATLLTSCGSPTNPAAPPAGTTDRAPQPRPAAASQSASPTSPPTSPSPSPTPAAPPAGVLDQKVLVGFCGAPGSPALGRMTGDLRAAGARLTKQIHAFPHQSRPFGPVVELIATTVQAAPGADGMYRARAGTTTVQHYLDQARRMKGTLLLNIQPGRADFLPEVRAYERWLRQPDVGIALDPEWAVDGGQVPGEEFGHTTGAELNQVAAYLSALAKQHDLPPKLMIYHQLAAKIVRGESALRAHDRVSIVKVVDGIGSAAAKKATWRRLMKTKPAHVAAGFKLFYDEDTRHGTPLMTPAQVMALRPTPAYVVYE